MSATINCKEFADYFGNPICGKMNPAYVFDVEGVPYAIEEFYLDDLKALFSYTAVRWKMFSDANVFCTKAKWLICECNVCLYQTELLDPEDPQISVEMYKLSVSLIQSFDEMEGRDSRWGLIILVHLSESQLSTHHFILYLSSNGKEQTSSEQGSVLVFLPGIHEISYMQEALSQLFHKRWAFANYTR